MKELIKDLLVLFITSIIAGVLLTYIVNNTTGIITFLLILLFVISYLLIESLFKSGKQHE